MLDSPTRANAHDFKQRYCNGYGIYITESKKRVVVWLHTITHQRLHFRDSGGQEYFVNFDTDASFEFLPSVRGWHHQPHRAVFLARIPARQYNRGINDNNTTVSTYTEGGFQSQGVDHALVESLFGEAPLPLLNRVSNMLAGSVDFCVLSLYFCLNQGSVLLSTIPIGTYDITPTGIVVTLTNPLAFQELTDLITRNNLPIKVSV